MAFFKFRWPGRQEPSGDTNKPAKRSRTPQAESIEEMRRRARHRLLGAAVLVLVGVVGFPLLFDTQPRPVPVNVAMDIPDRHKVAPLVVPQQEANTPRAAEPATSGLDAGEEVVASRPRSAPAASQPAARAEPKVPAKAETPAESKPEPKPEPKPAPKAEAKTESKPEPRPDPKPARQDDAARARALLEGRNPQPSAAPAAAREEQGRFIVQVGAFADADKAREVRDRLERSGLKTYTQVVDTKDGKRTRVRVGPFTSRADADKAAGRVKGAGLSASVLAL
ncbi:SPOR domain-containing protein [Diaphorobacter sp. ED-3]|uniref:SPOR domain-containing protein n=2 Tax=unclassified Diaphorobacter TaxID=2649760 RepID=UPI0022DD3EF5|nr:SPOR domain-containing protein [Diaphorobacter sp. ED-3]